ncbi:MAG: endopeptidase La [Acidobacteria bacterium]|nr:endopeptidase La [Acidobacteriota bacterium]
MARKSDFGGNERELGPSEHSLVPGDERAHGDAPDAMGILPLRNSVLFPHAVMPISVGRRKTLALIENALDKDLHIAVVSQKDASVDDPSTDDLYTYGTTARILKAIRVGGGNINLIIQGLDRVRVERYTQHEPFLAGEIARLPEQETAGLSIEASARNLAMQFRKLVEIHPNLSGDIAELSLPENEPDRLADLVASVLPIPVADKMELLPITSLEERLDKITHRVVREIQVTELGSQIQSRVMDEVGKTQRQFYLREQMKAIQRELGEGDERTKEMDELKAKLEQAKLPDEAREIAERELDRLSGMSPASAEYTVARTYLDWLVNLPWSVTTEDKIDLKKTRTILDEDHYDLEKVKDRILEYLAVRKRKPDLKGPILCLVGPPGTGKTSLGRSVARAMERKFVRVSLGGVRDEAEIRGHRRTYVAALPGRIIQGLKRAGSKNPVFVLDEIDKLGADFRGDPSSALLEVLDPEQNHTFSDHYLEVPFDLSQVFFICTANVLDTIPPALRDRMEVLSLPGYTEEEKVEIARRHLIPRQIEFNGLADAHVEITQDAVQRVIGEYTREAGLRNLEREIASLCRKIARRIVEQGEGQDTLPSVKVTADDIPGYLGPAHFYRELAERADRPGVAIGLAWTQAGGDILFIESTRMPGRGKLTITGRLGEVMKESAQAALSWIRANAGRFGVGPEVFEKNDLHVHVPAGAIPKDGPSAGVTLAVSLLSLLIGRPVRPQLAMTGELTLRGKVLPVGGIKEKVLAARRAGVSRVLLPRHNEKDLEDVQPELRQNLEFVFVDELDDVIRESLGEIVVPDPAPAVLQPERAIDVAGRVEVVESVTPED